MQRLNTDKKYLLTDFISLRNYDAEINDFIAAIGITLKPETELKYWFLIEGKKIFDNALQAYYEKFINGREFMSVTIGFMGLWIKEGFNALYPALIQKLLNETCDYNSSQLDYIIKPEFDKLVNTIKSSRSLLLALETAIFNDLHKYFKKNPETVFSNDFVLNFKKDKFQEALHQINSQMAYLPSNRTCENYPEKNPGSASPKLYKPPVISSVSTQPETKNNLKI